MKAIVVSQPQASMIALGNLRAVERCFSTFYRGPLLICSSTQRITRAVEFEAKRACRRLTLPLPWGKAVAVVDLWAIAPMRPADGSRWMSYKPGRYCWVFERVRAIEPLIDIEGEPGLFDVVISSVRVESGQILAGAALERTSTFIGREEALRNELEECRDRLADAESRIRDMEAAQTHRR